MQPVKLGIFSMTPPTPVDDDGSYLRWHLLDHMPEQYQIPGIVLAHRWTAGPDLQAARIAGDGPYADIANLVEYYVGDPVEPALEDFFVLGSRLAELGRFPARRPSLGLRMLGLLRWYAAPQALIAPEVVAYRPHKGILLLVEEPTEGAVGEWLQWMHTEHLPELLAVPGVAGAGVYRTTGTWKIPAPAAGPDVLFTVVYLDDDPVATTKALNPVVEQRWASGAVRPLFAGPLAAMVDWGGLAVRLAVASPVVTMNPGSHVPWEEHGTIEDLATVAEAADRLGYHHLTCSEHVGLPAVELERRGARYWDPLATFGYLAARTEQIRFATHVLVLGYHHPLEIAKRYGTLDVVSGGRVILGVGVGSLEAEFDLIGATFEGRGERADDALRALRASLSQREPAYHGEHYDFEGFVIDPAAVQDHVPIWVGGRTLRSLRRAATLADGWNPFAVPPAQAQEWLAKVDVPPGFEVILPTVKRVEPIDDPERTRETLAATDACGATIAYATFRHGSLTEYLEKLDALAALHAGMNL